MLEDELIQLAKKGNQQACRKLVELHYRTVERFTYQVGNSYHEVEDIT
ncbi:hypothetical protein [Bacillus solimangrovi]|nr:hypothetical protein [Bacillus solimangrovi]